MVNKSSIIDRCCALSAADKSSEIPVNAAGFSFPTDKVGVPVNAARSAGRSQVYYTVLKFEKAVITVQKRRKLPKYLSIHL